MNLSVLNLRVEQNVAIVEMNNPPVNALTPIFLDEFAQVLDFLRTEKGVRALILGSTLPGFFSAGDDVSKLTDADEAILDELPRVHETMHAIESLPLPTVAAINGHALGGGFELALACDFRVMAEGPGLVGLPEIRLGMIPAFGGTQRITQLVGKARALELMIKGLQLPAQQALELGLITKIFPSAEFSEKAFDYARRLALQPTLAIARIKECVLAGIYEGAEAGFATEQKCCRENLFSDDAKEGVNAFLSGRKPHFKGF